MKEKYEIKKQKRDNKIKLSNFGALKYYADSLCFFLFMLNVKRLKTESIMQY